MRFYQEDLNSSLIKILEQIKLIGKGQEKPHRVLIFFDPYGLQVKWDTIEKITHKKVFKIIKFAQRSYMAIQFVDGSER